MSETDSDAELLLAWRSGDARAGSELVNRHARTVLRFFRRKVDEGAEDLVQRTFLAAVESRDRVVDVHGFRAYILGIARYEFTRALRRNARTTRPHLDHASVASPSAVAGASQEHRRLLIALRRLPLDLQIAVELHYWEEMTTREIAAVLDVAAGTIKWRLSRARDLLAAELAELPAFAEPATADDLDRWIASMRAVVSDPSEPE